jgi:subtilase family serine protease
MHSVRSTRSALVVLVLAAVVTAALAGASASSAAGLEAHPMTVNPEMARVAGTPGPAARHFNCQDRPIDGSLGLKCYGPAQIQAAYGYSGLLSSGIDGTGKTIVIVDAFANPFLTGPTGDLALEDATFDLPDPPSFTVLQEPNPVPAFDINDPAQFSFASEETLDVEWAHVMAPGAKIVLAEAASNSDTDLFATTKYVIDHHIGDVISQSFGEAETCMDPDLLAAQHALFAKAVSEGYTLFSGTGDSGAAQFNCDGTGAIESASTPASDPHVTAIGGTTLNADGETGAYIGETTWTELPTIGCNPPALDLPFDVNCSGGDFSTIYSRPPWQASQVKNPERGLPDVAFSAGVNAGVLTVCSVCDGGPPAFFLFGGTSVGPPAWSGLTVDTDQMVGHDVGDINRLLYQIGQSSHARADLHDVTTGNNDVAEIGGAGFDAGPGWDPVTGLGSPDAANLLPDLAHRS